MHAVTINGTEHEVDADHDDMPHSIPSNAVAGTPVTTAEGPQCGRCPAGQMRSAAAMLSAISSPTEEQIEAAMAGNLCRCASYFGIRKAIRRASSGGVAGR